MVVWRVLLASSLLTGCDWYAGTPEPIALPASFADPVCRDVARMRSSDAAVNGIDVALLARIARDSYASCVQNKAR